ncbi:hypothetical protein R2A130_2265 [Ahrensia sp. R2A130]|nr:hypothetical protein R2A130_2265 [Ahrensia sp. R2A130]
MQQPQKLQKQKALPNKTTLDRAKDGEEPFGMQSSRPRGAQGEAR